jgi:hypothetical protein
MTIMVCNSNNHISLNDSLENLDDDVFSQESDNLIAVSMI